MIQPGSILLAMKLVRRELRGGLRGFGVFLTCLFLGVFAISAIGSFTESAKSGLLADAGALLGGDLEVRLAHRELARAPLDFLNKNGKVSQVATMRTMVASQTGSKRVLGELKAVDSNYPLYGQVETEPRLTFSDAFNNSEQGALVESSLLSRLEITVGDRIVIGDAEFVVKGVLTTEPDRAVRAFSLGPRVMISLDGLAATKLVQPGSLVYYAYRLKLPDRNAVEQFTQKLNSEFPEAGWRVRSWREATPRVRFFLDRINLNMTLIGLCALLVGGLGVSGAVRGYLGGKSTHIATMKCLGASGELVFTAYLLQILFLGVVGSVAGLVCGAALPFILANLIGSHLPIPLAPSVHWHVLTTAALFGLLIALVFSLKSLGIASQVSPSVLFRGYSDIERGTPGKRVMVAIIIAALCLAGLAVLTSSDKKLAFWFICGATLCFGIFRYAAAAVVKLARHLPRPENPSLRLGIGNIHRRGSPAGSALFSLGLGLTALVIIMLVQANLDDRVNETVPQEAPSFFFLDIQPHQVESFEATAAKLPGVKKIERYPTLRGRIAAINGIPADKAEVDQEVRWAVRGDRFLSYAAQIPPDTIIVDGEWWSENYAGEPLISLTSDLAKGFHVGIGDTLTVNVLGRDVTARISSLREVDWSSLDLNFALILSPGTLTGAPQTNIASIHVPPEYEDEAYATMTSRFTNVSVISTREVLKNVSNTLARIGIAFRSMAAIALLTGFLVLAGAVSADQHRRIQDAVIFKVCGATRMDILGAFATEFLLLGVVAGSISSIVGSIAAMGILKGLMKTDFTLHPEVILATIMIGVVLTLTLGLLGTWKALGHKPAEYLRGE